MTDSEPELIYVFLPDPLGPLDRGDKYEDPIIDELDRLGLGEVSGAGTALGDQRPDGTRPIESCGIDVDTRDPVAARAALRTLLPKLGCPAGTQLHYSIAGKPLLDEYDGADWKLETERAESEPGTGTRSRY